MRCATIKKQTGTKKHKTKRTGVIQVCGGMHTDTSDSGKLYYWYQCVLMDHRHTDSQDPFEFTGQNTSLTSLTHPVRW